MTENNTPQEIIEIDEVFDRILPRLDPVSGKSALLKEKIKLIVKDPHFLQQLNSLILA